VKFHDFSVFPEDREGVFVLIICNTIT